MDRLWRAEVVRWYTNGQAVVYQHPFAPQPAAPGPHRLRIGWTGSRIRARHRMTDWAGSLRVQTGKSRIVSATAWGFDQPEHGYRYQKECAVRWSTETAAEWDGVVVAVS